MIKTQNKYACLLIKISFIIFIFFNVLNAKEYSKEQIKNHLETIFVKEIRYEKQNKNKRYLPFSNKIRIYYEFSGSIKNQKEKINILKKEIKKFEKITNLDIELKQGKPDITLSEENGMLKTIYNSEDSLYEQHIYFGFSNRDEIFEKIKKGYWYKQFILGKNSDIMYKKVVDYMSKERDFFRNEGNTIII